jgi:Fe-S-cluster containining protein
LATTEREPDGGGAPPPWYADGLRFECTQCGNCCSGPPGAVWFTPDEADAMSAALGVDIDTFLATYTRRLGARRSLKELVRGGRHDCIFLDRETVPGKARCAIYSARPSQCRTWPWWPEVVETPEAWAETKRRTPCPGMDAGPVHSLVEITIGLTGG